MSVARIAVVVPARDEAELLPGCLAALAVAAARVACPVRVCVVLDGCRDDSAAVVAGATGRGLDLDSLVVDAGVVGVARARGVEHLLAGTGPAGMWIASTDADSRVPPHWLTRQLHYAAAGARLVAGTVRVEDWTGHGAATRARAAREYAAGTGRPDGHGHVHGANLGIDAGTYQAAGGFPPLAVHEDVALVDAVLATGAPVTWAEDLPVVTSARRAGRVRGGGFARYLTSLA